MELLLDLYPYVGTILAILIVFFAGKKGITLNKEATISTTMLVIDKLLSIFNIVETNSEKTGIRHDDKLNMAVNKAYLSMTPEELSIIKTFGNRANKATDKPTFKDTLKAGVQDVFISSVSMLAKDKIGAFIKKI
jgi:hypothetical protein